MILEVKNGSFSYGQREILRNISFCLEEQKIMTILGPNGVGKTTLLKCIMGFLPWNRGEARILEKNLNVYSDKELWKQISYVPQAKRSAFSYGVLEMVVMGLDKENSFFYTPKKDHFDRANEMLKELGVGKLAGRYCNELSGGELQMVMLARALVSGPKLLILDEPESNLDMKNQLRVLDAISYINQEKNTACIINTHFPAHALQLSDKTLLLGQNYRQKFGDTAEIITENNVEEFFQTHARILDFQRKEEPTERSHLTGSLTMTGKMRKRGEKNEVYSFRTFRNFRVQNFHGDPSSERSGRYGQTCSKLLICL